ncbi:MAG: precorrin-6y C5,15-methyltransferase (decarboxylating) subunit CbiE (plasmid) [Candidatus Manganitrophus sp.]|nr:MAG: precorrin-6y C5,15-methyltransferase (decarboxylating) subunit CbiE [Candidatus Manganitrophus sp.]
MSGLKEGKRVVVLASGDPLFYGIGAFLIKRIGKERVEVVPAVSAMQLAFARVKEPWQEAALVSLHAKPIENLLPALEEKGLIGLFTARPIPPTRSPVSSWSGARPVGPGGFAKIWAGQKSGSAR